MSLRWKSTLNLQDFSTLLKTILTNSTVYTLHTGSQALILLSVMVQTDVASLCSKEKLWRRNWVCVYRFQLCLCIHVCEAEVPLVKCGCGQWVYHTVFQPYVRSVLLLWTICCTCCCCWIRESMHLLDRVLN